MFAKESQLKNTKQLSLFFFLKQAARIVSWDWETVPKTVCMYMNNVDGSVGPTSSLGMTIKIELFVEDNLYDLVRGRVGQIQQYLNVRIVLTTNRGE